MNLLKKIFKSDSLRSDMRGKYTSGFHEGIEYFNIGKELYNESLLTTPMHKERREQKIIAALELFDKAIEKGYQEYESYLLRAMCLRTLNYDIEAVEDLNKSIEKEPEKANLYYGRAITKQYMHDYEGSLSDFEEAIRLAKLNNDNTRYWNEYAKVGGYDSVIEKYELDLYWLMQDIERSKNCKTGKVAVQEGKIKRRFK